MRFKTKTSLHTALWLVIAIATVPALLLQTAAVVTSALLPAE